MRGRPLPLSEEVAAARHAVRFLRGLRTFSRIPPPTVEDAKSILAGDVVRRPQRFAAVLDQLVWGRPQSPYHQLLRHAGIERGDVEKALQHDGLDATLERLRDEGVFVTYAEWRGLEPIRRGSLTLDVSPPDFFNPLLPTDVIGTTGGSRSEGLPVVSSFRHATRGAIRETVREEMWGLRGAPRAVWLPVMPSAAGLTTTLRLMAAGSAPERWFTPVDPRTLPVSLQKRFANRYLPVAARVAGAPIPRPQYVPPAAPAAALEWCQHALARHGRAGIGGYASSLVSLAAAATEAGVDLTGLVMSLSGEPVTASKAAAIRRSGATPNNRYAFMQVGGVAGSCPYTGDEELHLNESEVAVVDREVRRPDGVAVRALLWTTIGVGSRSVFINVENDDYGEIVRDAPACACLLGQLGHRVLLRNIRGVSKVVTGGITLTGEVVERLVNDTLPAALGGGPADFQFVEREEGGASTLTLRVHPRLDVDAERALAVVRDALKRTEPGLLASEVWDHSGAWRVERVPPMTTTSGKVMPFERAPR